MITQIQKKYCIKIPDNIKVFYCSKKKIIVFSSDLVKTSLKLKVQLFFSKKDNIIKVSSLPFGSTSFIEKKNLLKMQGTTCALIKQKLIETTSVLYKKLKLVGVGYRLVTEENFDNQLILLKLGFSHFIYFRITKRFSFFLKKRTQLFVSGQSYQGLTQLVSNIRMLKVPEPYKGKGILYEDEKIVLKEGKKV